MLLFKDYYKILGFETNRVNVDEIKIAYREQAKKYHPDLNDGSSNSEERFKDINEAYRVLSNPSTRRKYDKNWNSNIGRQKNKERNGRDINQSDNIFEELKYMLFGIQKKNKVKSKKSKIKVKAKGENIETAANVSIQEAFFGTTKKISLRAVNR